MLLFQLAASDVALGETKNWCYLVIDKINTDLQFIADEQNDNFFVY